MLSVRSVHQLKELWDFAHQLKERPDPSEPQLKLDAAAVRKEIYWLYVEVTNSNVPNRQPPKYSAFFNRQKLKELLVACDANVINTFLNKIELDLVFIEEKIAAHMAPDVDAFAASRRVKEELAAGAYNEEFKKRCKKELPQLHADDCKIDKRLGGSLAFSFLRLEAVNALTKNLLIKPEVAFGTIIHPLRGGELRCIEMDTITLKQHASRLVNMDLSIDEIESDFMRVVNGYPSRIIQDVRIHVGHEGSDGNPTSHPGYGDTLKANVTAFFSPQLKASLIQTLHDLKNHTPFTDAKIQPYVGPSYHDQHDDEDELLESEFPDESDFDYSNNLVLPAQMHDPVQPLTINQTPNNNIFTTLALPLACVFAALLVYLARRYCNAHFQNRQFQPKKDTPILPEARKLIASQRASSQGESGLGNNTHDNDVIVPARTTRKKRY